MQIYYYHIYYNGITDDFFGIIDDDKIKGKTVFQIDTSDEMCEYIETGVMKHIDDVEGLENHLKKQEILKKDDKILLDEEILK